MTFIRCAALWAAIIVAVSALESIESGLLVHYKFDENSGNLAADHSGNGFDGAISGDTAEMWVNGGMSGNALQFDGTFYVSVPAEAFHGINDTLSVCMWLDGDLDGLPGAEDAYAFLAETEAGSDAFSFKATDTERWLLVSYGNDNDTVSADDYAFYATEFQGRYRHWCYTRNVTGGTMFGYRDGDHEKHLTAESDVSLPPLTRFRVGVGYIGLIDDVRIYARALLEEDVEEIMRAGIDEDARSQPFVQYHFNETDGFVVTDYSGNGYDGELVYDNTTSQNDWDINAEALRMHIANQVVVPSEGFTRLADGMSVCYWISGDTKQQQENVGSLQKLFSCSYRGNVTYETYTPANDGTVGFRIDSDRLGWDPHSMEYYTENGFEAGWQHWCFTVHLYTLEHTVYKNGEVFASSSTFDISQMSYITDCLIGDDYFGFVGFFEAFSKVLTASEVSARLEASHPTQPEEAESEVDSKVVVGVAGVIFGITCLAIVLVFVRYRLRIAKQRSYRPVEMQNKV